MAFPGQSFQYSSGLANPTITNGVLTFPDGSAQSSTSIGYGQTWQNVAANRAFGTTYTNTTGRPITVAVTLGSNGTQFDAFLIAAVNGLTIAGNGPSSGATSLGNFFSALIFIVPPNNTYVANYASSYGTTKTYWTELR